MPKSKSRAKKSKGKAWRTGRAGSEYQDNSVAEPASDFDIALPDGMLEALAESLAEEAEQVYGDEELGRVLIRRGWEPMHEHIEDSSDMWSWLPSAPDDDSWVPTMVTVLEDGYLVQFADYEALMRDQFAEYGSREELLDDIEAIEAHRHPADPRQGIDGGG
ncbi:hypothetical protein [Mycobacterium sp. MS1601]|uniref:hypothetical protein n=1 Tax=Mycobacterium sp. MS1601 TaxID=1936029 RepID=UPI0009F9DA02|nr:hypothetical protein [Mycobacterium sp. MS1601]